MDRRRNKTRKLNLESLESRYLLSGTPLDWYIEPRTLGDIGTGRILMPNTESYANPSIEQPSAPYKLVLNVAGLRMNDGSLPTNVNVAVERIATRDRFPVHKIGERLFEFDTLFEGEYAVVIAGSRGNDNVIKTEVIEVDDILVVAMGDSYSSGEGAPEVVRSETVNQACTAVDESDSAGWAQGVDSGACWASNPVNIDHMQSHRSSFAASAQMAQRLELADPHTSVSFVFLSMSGATINKGGINGFAGANSEIWYDETRLMDSQVSAAEKMIGSRSPDILTLSFGGNDIGFSSIVTSLLLQETHDPTFFDALRMAVQSGKEADWRAVESAIDSEFWIDVANLFIRLIDTEGDLAGLDGLAADYDELADQLKIRLNPKSVYITEYPNPSYEFGPLGNAQLSPKILHDIKNGLEVSSTISTPGGSGELQWVGKFVVNPLNAKVREAAERNGWQYVAGIDSAFRGHGYASAKPWITTASVSEATQGPDSVLETKGTIHPNVAGHSAIADILFGQISADFGTPSCNAFLASSVGVATRSACAPQRTMYLIGPGTSNEVEVVQRDGEIVATLNGQPWQSAPAGSVDLIAFWGGDGRDVFENRTRIDSVAFGGTGNDTLTGGSGNDTLHGGDNRDRLFGGSGHDELFGEGGNDRILNGGKGRDTIWGGPGNDRLLGKNGSDTLYGESGDDVLIGGGRKDHLYGGNGNDKLFGNKGNDEIYGGNGNDIIEGGKGKDELYGSVKYSNDYDSTLSDIDTISGGDQDDTIFGGNDRDIISGDDGSDRIYGGFGNDTIHGNSGVDYLYGEDQNDELFGGDGNDELFGGNHDDKLWGEGGENVAKGEGGNDTFFVKDSDSDFLWGHHGEDTYVFEAGASSRVEIWDREGKDTLDLSRLHEGVSLDLNRTTRQQIAPSGLSIDLLFHDTIDIVIGTDHADDVWTSSIDNEIYANRGNDRLHSRGGRDRLHGFQDDDTYIVSGRHGGYVEIWDLEGDNTLDLSAFESAVTIDLANTAPQTISETGLELDLLFADSVDHLLGTSFSDAIFGNSNANRFEGGLGDDFLFGRDGRDVLIGEDGKDWIVGGGGDDEIIAGPSGAEIPGYIPSELLLGGNGNDTILGGSQYDLVYGGYGSDVIYGGPGNDFLIDGPNTSFGADSIPNCWFSNFENPSYQELTQCRAAYADGTGSSALWRMMESFELNGGDGTYRNDTERDQVFGESDQDAFAVCMDQTDWSASQDFRLLLCKGKGARNPTPATIATSIEIDQQGDADSAIDRLPIGNPMISEGVVEVTATHDNDRIVVTQKDGEILVEVNGAVTRFEIETVDSLALRLRSGDDFVRNDTAISMFVQSGPGNDEIYGGDSSDQLFGGAGNDLLIGNGGNDEIVGGDGHDYLLGKSGEDVLRGNGGDDVLRGGEGDDIVSGGQGNDSIRGGIGDDVLIGGGGSDYLNTVDGVFENDVVQDEDGINRVIRDKAPSDDELITAAPALVRPQNLSEGVRRQAAFSWQNVQFAEQYILRIFGDGREVRTFVVQRGSGDTTSFTIPESSRLRRLSDYVWTVEGTNDATAGPRSESWGFETRNTSPFNAPTNVSPSDGKTAVRRQANLSWSNLNSATEYLVEVFREGQDGPGRSFVVPESQGMTTNFTIPESEILRRQTTYYFTVTGRNSAGDGPVSSPTFFTTRNTVPDNAPVNLRPANGAMEVRRQTQFAWDNLSNADEYVLRLYRNGNEVREIIVPKTSGGQTTLTLAEAEQLLRFSTYSFTVTGRNSAGEGPTSPAQTFTTRNTVPDNAPVNLRPANGAMEVRRQTQFAWDNLSNADEYVLRLYRNGNEVREIIVPKTSGGQTTLTLAEAEQLLRFSTYSFTVTGRNSAGEGPTSPAQTFTTRNTVPDNAPVNLRPANGAMEVRRQTQFAWDNLSNADEYVLRLYRNGNEVREIIVPKTSGGQTTLTLTEAEQLLRFSTYSFTVTGRNSAGEGPTSPAQTFTTRNTVPDNAPVNLRPANGAMEVRRQTQFAWDNLSNADEYVLRLYRNGNEVREIIVPKTSGGQTTLTLTEAEQLLRFSTYSFTVTGRNSAGEGPTSPAQTFTTRNTVPDNAPVNLRPANGAMEVRRQTQFAWDNLSNADEYVLRLYRNGNEVREIIVPKTSGGQTTLTLTEAEQLLRFSTYSFTVTGRNSAGEGPTSPAQTFTTRNTVPDNAPVNLRPANGAMEVRRQTQFAWDNLSNADEYVLRLYRNGNEVREIIVPKTSGARTAYELSEDQQLRRLSTYSFTVTGRNSAGEGPTSPAQTFTTRNTAQAIPAEAANLDLLPKWSSLKRLQRTSRRSR